jgi:hypothetical protein
MSDQKTIDKPGYTAPALTVLGSLHALTMQDKKFGHSDGFTLLGVAITNNSP